MMITRSKKTRQGIEGWQWPRDFLNFTLGLSNTHTGGPLFCLQVEESGPKLCVYFEWWTERERAGDSFHGSLVATKDHFIPILLLLLQTHPLPSSKCGFGINREQEVLFDRYKQSLLRVKQILHDVYWKNIAARKKYSTAKLIFQVATLASFSSSSVVSSPRLMTSRRRCSNAWEEVDLVKPQFIMDGRDRKERKRLHKMFFRTGFFTLPPKLSPLRTK